MDEKARGEAYKRGGNAEAQGKVEAQGKRATAKHTCKSTKHYVDLAVASVHFLLYVLYRDGSVSTAHAHGPACRSINTPP